MIVVKQYLLYNKEGEERWNPDVKYDFTIIKSTFPYKTPDIQRFELYGRDIEEYLREKRLLNSFTIEEILEHSLVLQTQVDGSGIYSPVVSLGEKLDLSQWRKSPEVTLLETIKKIDG